MIQNRQKKKPAKSREVRDEEKRQRTLVSSVLWPFLVSHSKHINEAKNILQACVIGIQEAYDKEMLEEQKRISKKHIEDFDIESTILKKHDYATEYKLIELFEGETLATTKGLLQGMSQVIDSFIKEEMAGRKLETLKTDFLN